MSFPTYPYCISSSLLELLGLRGNHVETCKKPKVCGKPQNRGKLLFGRAGGGVKRETLSQPTRFLVA